MLVNIATICTFHGPVIRKTTRSDIRHGARIGFRLVYRTPGPKFSVSLHSNTAASTVYFIVRANVHAYCFVKPPPPPAHAHADVPLGHLVPAQAIQFPRSMSESPGVTFNFHHKTTVSYGSICNCHSSNRSEHRVISRHLPRRLRTLLQLNININNPSSSSHDGILWLPC